MSISKTSSLFLWAHSLTAAAGLWLGFAVDNQLRTFDQNTGGTLRQGDYPAYTVSMSAFFPSPPSPPPAPHPRPPRAATTR
jgi:hypothetical protein